MVQKFDISRDEAIEKVVASLPGPASLDEVVDRVLALWPSKAKTARQSVRTALRQYQAGQTVLFLDQDTLVPISIALQGVKFRIPVDDQFADTGLLSIYPAFRCLNPQHTPLPMANFIDAEGQPISLAASSRTRTKETVFGPHTFEEPVFDLSGWCLAHNPQPDDSLLLTIENWEERQFRLELEAADVTNTHQEEIEQRNRALSDQLFAMLESARHTSISDCKATLTAHARLPDPTGYPGDHWLAVLEADERMGWTNSDIRYADDLFLFDMPTFEEEEAMADPISLSAEEAHQIYLFKAALWRRKGLWRRIEIKGEQTLANLDRMLRRAFEHEPDHMSGFWKRVRRGKSRRFREVDLGSFTPFGETDDTYDPFIAELELKPGDELKYVYDFGDWIEHRITLEAITEAEEGVSYPRVVEKNKPRYRYCQHCKEEGQKTVATWICIECSDAQQAEVLVCEDCLYEHHEGHYADEILY